MAERVIVTRLRFVGDPEKCAVYDAIMRETREMCGQRPMGDDELAKARYTIGGT